MTLDTGVTIPLDQDKAYLKSFPYRNPESQTGSKNTVKNARQTPTQNKNMT